MKTSSCLSWFLVARILPLSVLFLLVALLPAPALERGPERIVKEGEGEAEIQDQDLSGARRKALDEALRKAFEEAVMEVLPLELSLADRQSFVERIAPRLKEALMQYRILSEMPALNLYVVTVEATFSGPQIREGLAGLGAFPAEEATAEAAAYLVRFRGISSMGLYRKVREVFREEMPRVRSAVPWEVYGNEMVLRVLFGGTLDELAAEIEGREVEEGVALRVEERGEKGMTVLVGGEDAGSGPTGDAGEVGPDR